MKVKEDNKKILYLNLKTYQSPHIKNQIVGLFIHDKPDSTFEQNLYIKEKVFLYRSTVNEINVYNSQNQHQEDEESITSISIRNGDFFLTTKISFSLYNLTTQDINNIQNQLWYVMNLDEEMKKQNNTERGENEDYCLCEGDIIKFGIELYILRKINISNYNNITDNNEKNIYNIHSLNNNKGIIFDLYTEPKVLDEQNFCTHIINELNDPNEKENYKQKIEKEIIIKNNVKYYKFNLNNVNKCNKCNKIYPLRFKKTEESEIIDLINIDIPKNKNYIILESIKIDSLEIYVIELTGEDENITIGRREENNIVIDRENKTVTRNHAVIKYYKNERKLILKDKSNYAGTMVLIKNKIKISEKKEIYLQAGRTFIMAKVIDENEYIKKLKDDYFKEKEEKEKKEEQIKAVDEKESYKLEKSDEFYGEVKQEYDSTKFQ